MRSHAPRRFVLGSNVLPDFIGLPRLLRLADTAVTAEAVPGT